MTARLLLTLTALTLGLAPARGQEVLTAPPGGQFALLPADPNVVSTSPLFLDDPGRGRFGSTNAVGGVAGSAAGRVSAGFDFLRPFWTFRDFALTVPPQYAAAFPANLGVTHGDNNFVVVPQVRYNYHVSDLDLNIEGSGTFLSLSGRLQRSLTATDGPSGDLVVNYNLTQVSVIPFEVARRIDPAELFLDKDHEAEEGSALDLSIGTRFVSVDQNYTSTLTANGLGGSNVATRYSSQNFRGLGLTAAAEWQVPFRENWVRFLNVRGSVLIGDSRRNSTLTVVAAGFPGASETISESRTTLLPVGEAEIGVEWGQELGGRLARREVPPEMTIRVAGVGQYWGGMGPLSAGSTQGFRTSDLFLAGVSVQIGFRH